MAKEMNFEALQANLRLIDKKGELAYERAKAEGSLTPREEKFSALISDEEFAVKLLESESSEEVRALFKENGLEISENEIDALGRYIAEVSSKLVENGGELSEEDLESISGGTITSGFGFSEQEDDIGNVVGGITATAGIAGGVLGGTKLGFAIGTAICPGIGSLIGTGIGGLLGLAGGAISGAAAGYFTGVGITKGIKKLGGWIKSWF